MESDETIQLGAKTLKKGSQSRTEKLRAESTETRSRTRGPDEARQSHFIEIFSSPQGSQLESLFTLPSNQSESSH
ncbi:hypothetical protein TNCV_802921 [Trichonephila clavipes]|nr:hypothetical protein TNCV_802921 [Trichonephila clavipes]